MVNKFFTFDDFKPVSSNLSLYGSSKNLKVIGVGGIGCKLINRLNEIGMHCDDLIAIDSDIQNLLETKSGSRIHIWENLSGGKGAKQDNIARRKIVEEFTENLSNELKDSGFIFVVSGLGSRVSTDTLPIIGDIAKELGLLTIGIFTEPYTFENPQRVQASKICLGIFEKQGHTSIVFPLDNVTSRIVNYQMQESISDIVIQMLTQCINSIWDLVSVPGLINLDFADIRSVFGGKPRGFMAFGKASGKGRAKIAAKRVVSNIIGDISINDINSIFFNITGSSDLTLYEVNQVASYIKDKLSNNSVNLIFGAIIDPSLTTEIRITIIGTGSRALFGESMDYEKIKGLDIQSDDYNKERKRDLSVFLCHSSSDKHIVRKIYQRLYSQVGIDPWLDEAKLLPGENWDNEISKAVDESDVVIVCLSNNSINKEGYVQKEIARALDVAEQKPEGTIFIIPLKLEECPVPRRLSAWQWLDYFQDNTHEKLILSLRKRAESLGIELG